MPDGESFQDRFNRFMDNEWPHAQRLIGEVKGRVELLMWAAGAMLVLLGAVLGKLLVG
jgi:hypothetical protein